LTRGYPESAEERILARHPRSLRICHSWIKENEGSGCPWTMWVEIPNQFVSVWPGYDNKFRNLPILRSSKSRLTLLTLERGTASLEKSI